MIKLDDDGLPVGFARVYNRVFAGQPADTQQLARCEELWRAALADRAERAVPVGWVIQRGGGGCTNAAITLRAPNGDSVAVVAEPTDARMLPEAVLYQLAAALIPSSGAGGSTS